MAATEPQERCTNAQHSKIVVATCSAVEPSSGFVSFQGKCTECGQQKGACLGAKQIAAWLNTVALEGGLTLTIESV